MQKTEVLGIDVGGVILDFIPYLGTDLDIKGDSYLQTPEVEGAIDAIAELNRGKFKDRVHLVTKYDPEYGPGRVIEWLEHRNFFERTGITMERYHPCPGRHDKAPICANLGVTHFIDDRAEVLSHMIGQVENLYLFKSTDADKEEFAEFIPKLKKVDSWKEVLMELSA